MKRLFEMHLLFIACITALACNNQQTDQQKTSSGIDSTIEREVAIKEDSVQYSAGNKIMNGYVAYNANMEGRRPIVLVVHEWWGLNDYPRMRAKQLAEMGYLAMAVDMYGNGQIAGNPQEAQQLAGPFYQSPDLAKARLDAALARIKTYQQADTSRIAAIGYCFGGAVVLNAAKLGADLDGVVSFHGSLGGVPANRDLLKAKVLVCHGGADNFVPQKDVEAFRKSMDAIGADYRFKVYPEATHAFTNPDATETGKKFNMPITYNQAADSASWNDMKSFFSEIFK